MLTNEVYYEYATENGIIHPTLNKHLNKLKCRKRERPNILKITVLVCLIYSCLLYLKVFTSKLCGLEILLLLFIKNPFHVIVVKCS